MNFWENHFSRLQASLVAQIERIRAGSGHSTIKGTSIEVVLRHMLREYLPGHFSVRPGQIANSSISDNLSPQQDILVYDGKAFPHLAVNEDSSVIVCCESLVAVIECKTYWKQSEIGEHYKRTIKVESKRCKEFNSKYLFAGYFLFFHEPATPELVNFKDENRAIGFYCLKNDESWSSPLNEKEFRNTKLKVLETFFQDVLMHCMRIGQVEIGTFEDAYKVVSRYIGWQIENS